MFIEDGATPPPIQLYINFLSERQILWQSSKQQD